ncbi:MAG TPA: hypothetical protein PLT09_02435 [Deltaproteobacteria bacterium]|nr:hypothetical protein [Deltaproteobacteria bacterium]HPR54400.1 hypothetical protein [Deltaproteobacteria bacterium]HXK46271.1 hypothetical protein [Deltaproteobacteria bacterium]
MIDPIRKTLLAIRSLPFYPAFQTRVKYLTIDAILSFFGPAFEAVSSRVPEIKGELAQWEDGRRFAVGVLPDGPFITLEKRGDMVYYLGKGLHEPEISMLFKNLDAAIPVFVGIHGSFKAFAENRVLVKGNLAHTMEVNRIVNIVNAYLFPALVHHRVLKRPPRFTLAQTFTKARVYGGLIPAVIRHMI